MDVLGDFCEIAHIEPLSALRTFHVVIGVALSYAVEVFPGVAGNFSGHEGASSA